MRKYQQVKRKQIAFDMNEWEIIEKRAAKLKINTTEYIREAALAFNLSDYEPIDPDIINNLRRIGVNINQLAKKANEINSIYAGDYESMKEEFDQICHMLNAKQYTQG